MAESDHAFKKGEPDKPSDVHRQGRYGVALVSFGISLGLRVLLAPLVADTVPFLTFYAAIALSSWYGGLGPGLLVTALSGLATHFFFIRPAFSWSVDASALVALLFFYLTGIFITLLNHTRNRALARAAASEHIASYRLEQLQESVEAREKALHRELDTRRWAHDTLSSIGDGVICTDVDGRITFMNPVAIELTGWTLDDATNRSISDVFVIVNEDTRQPVLNPIHRVLQEGMIVGLANHTILVRKDGGDIPIDDSGAPIRNISRQIVGAVLVFRDITDRKASEKQLRVLNARLVRSNEDLASFAYMISHDLQAPLRAISTFSQMLDRTYRGRLDSEADQYLDFITKGAARMQRMISDLLKYSRATHGAPRFSAVKLSDAVNWAEHNLEESIRSSDAMVLCGELPTVKGDHVQLVQLFQNLIGNAIKYRSESTPHISISGSERDSFWLVTVRDNGRGIPDGDQKKVFELFKRGASTEEQGFGIGLAICRRIVEHHGGQIWVESSPGAGSTFSFTLAKDPATPSLAEQ